MYGPSGTNVMAGLAHGTCSLGVLGLLWPFMILPATLGCFVGVQKLLSRLSPLPNLKPRARRPGLSP